MARDENPPMIPGKTYPFFSDDKGQVIDPAGGAHLEGKEWEFEDLDYASTTTSGIVPKRSGKYVHRRLVRNANTSIYAHPKEFWIYKTDGATPDVFGGQVSGPASALGQVGGLVDEFLPAAGAGPGELFWLVIQGPAKAKTVSTGSPLAIAVGDPVVSAAAGGIAEVDSTAVGPAAINVLGHSMQAITATSTDIMILVKRMTG